MADIKLFEQFKKLVDDCYKDKYLSVGEGALLEKYFNLAEPIMERINENNKINEFIYYLDFHGCTKCSVFLHDFFCYQDKLIDSILNKSNTKPVSPDGSIPIVFQTRRNVLSDSNTPEPNPTTGQQKQINTSQTQANLLSDSNIHIPVREHEIIHDFNTGNENELIVPDPDPTEINTSQAEVLIDDNTPITEGRIRLRELQNKIAMRNLNLYRNTSSSNFVYRRRRGTPRILPIRRRPRIRMRVIRQRRKRPRRLNIKKRENTLLLNDKSRLSIEDINYFRSYIPLCKPSSFIKMLIIPVIINDTSQPNIDFTNEELVPKLVPPVIQTTGNLIPPEFPSLNIIYEERVELSACRADTNISPGNIIISEDGISLTSDVHISDVHNNYLSIPTNIFYASSLSKSKISVMPTIFETNESKITGNNIKPNINTNNQHIEANINSNQDIMSDLNNDMEMLGIGIQTVTEIRTSRASIENKNYLQILRERNPNINYAGQAGRCTRVRIRRNRQIFRTNDADIDQIYDNNNDREPENMQIEINDNIQEFKILQEDFMKTHGLKYQHLLKFDLDLYMNLFEPEEFDSFINVFKLLISSDGNPVAKAILLSLTLPSKEIKLRRCAVKSLTNLQIVEVLKEFDDAEDMDEEMDDDNFSAIKLKVSNH